jgi:hypothetical protein
MYSYILLLCFWVLACIGPVHATDIPADTSVAHVSSAVYCDWKAKITTMPKGCNDIGGSLILNILNDRQTFYSPYVFDPSHFEFNWFQVINGQEVEIREYYNSRQLDNLDVGSYRVRIKDVRDIPELYKDRCIKFLDANIQLEANLNEVSFKVTGLPGPTGGCAGNSVVRMQVANRDAVASDPYTVVYPEPCLNEINMPCTLGLAENKSVTVCATNSNPCGHYLNLTPANPTPPSSPSARYDYYFEYVEYPHHEKYTFEKAVTFELWFRIDEFYSSIYRGANRYYLICKQRNGLVRDAEDRFDHPQWPAFFCWVDGSGYINFSWGSSPAAEHQTVAKVQIIPANQIKGDSCYHMLLSLPGSITRASDADLYLNGERVILTNETPTTSVPLGLKAPLTTTTAVPFANDGPITLGVDLDYDAPRNGFFGVASYSHFYDHYFPPIPPGDFLNTPDMSLFLFRIYEKAFSEAEARTVWNATKDKCPSITAPLYHDSLVLNSIFNHSFGLDVTDFSSPPNNGRLPEWRPHRVPTNSQISYETTIPPLLFNYGVTSTRRDRNGGLWEPYVRLMSETVPAPISTVSCINPQCCKTFTIEKNYTRPSIVANPDVLNVSCNASGEYRLAATTITVTNGRPPTIDGSHGYTISVRKDGVLFGSPLTARPPTPPTTPPTFTAPLEGLSPGSYVVSTTDANGCTVTDTVTVTGYPPLEASIVGTPTIACGPCGSTSSGTARVRITGGNPNPDARKYRYKHPNGDPEWVDATDKPDEYDVDISYNDSGKVTIIIYDQTTCAIRLENVLVRTTAEYDRVLLESCQNCPNR